MFAYPWILPADANVTRSFFAQTLRDALVETGLGDPYNLDGDLPYMAGLLWHSAYYGVEHPFGIWGSERVPNSNILAICKRLDQAMSSKDAKITAEQLLLRLGLFEGRNFTFEQKCWFHNRGRILYLQAAQAQVPPARNRLESMAQHFGPWTDVLSDLGHREVLTIC